MNIRGHLKKITPGQCKDAGMALVLLLLIAMAMRGASSRLLYAAIAAQVLCMTVPAVFRLFAAVWFGFSHVMGLVMSKVILLILFFGILTPVALIRRLLRRDSMKLRAFKAGSGSVMIQRHHRFTAADMSEPY